jgi:hypothetical protein
LIQPGVVVVMIWCFREIKAWGAGRCQAAVGGIKDFLNLRMRIMSLANLGGILDAVFYTA